MDQHSKVPRHQGTDGNTPSEGYARPEPAKEQQDSIRAILLAASGSQRRQAILEAHLRQHLAQLLQLDPSQLGVDTPFKSFELGSLMALELTSRLEATLDLALSATLLWNYSTIASLATYLADRMSMEPEGGNGKSELGSRQPVPFPGSANGHEQHEQEDQSLDEVKASLAEELAAIDDLLGAAGAER